MSTNEKLLPCKAQTDRCGNLHIENECNMYWISCDCGMAGSYSYKREEAIELWNRVMKK